MSKIELELRPIFSSTKMEIELEDLGFSKESWNKLTELEKEVILDKYLSTYQPEKENFWCFHEWTPKY